MTNRTASAFPGTLVDALRFSERSRKDGWRVIGAASVPASGAQAAYDAWADMPFVYEDGFAEAFSTLVSRERVTKVFSSHEAVSRHLRRLLPDLCPGSNSRPASNLRATALSCK